MVAWINAQSPIFGEILNSEDASTKAKAAWSLGKELQVRMLDASWVTKCRSILVKGRPRKGRASASRRAKQGSEARQYAFKQDVPVKRLLGCVFEPYPADSQYQWKKFYNRSVKHPCNHTIKQGALEHELIHPHHYFVVQVGDGWKVVSGHRIHLFSLFVIVFVIPVSV